MIEPCKNWNEVKEFLSIMSHILFNNLITSDIDVTSYERSPCEEPFSVLTKYLFSYSKIIIKFY